MRPRGSAAIRPLHVLGMALAIALAWATAQAPPAQALEEPGLLAHTIAAPWPALQYPDGTFRDYVVRVAKRRHHRDPYGTSMLGYALLQEGIRTHDERLLRTALHALAHAAAHPVTNERVIFENLALASAYRLARARLRTDPAFASVRRVLENRLRHIRLVVLGGPRPYYNHDLVEAVAVLELLRAGLSSKVPGAVLGRGARAVRLARSLILRRLPAVAARQTRRNPRAGKFAILSDPPWNPLAYHALSTALVARAATLLRSRPLERLLQRLVTASWSLAAPDGDVSWWGRSQEQAWTLSLTAYAAGVAANLAGAGTAEAARDRALVERTLERLDSLYVRGPFGLFITPAVAENLRAGVAGLDDYAAAVPYTGWTLAGLEWALAQPPVAGSQGELGADEPGSLVVGRGPSAFAVVREGGVWFAVKQGPGVHVPGLPDYSRDLRYDAGLSALKVRDDHGGWHDVLPPRPRTRGAVNAAGPLLLRRGRLGRPFGVSLGIGRAGAVVLHGGFRTVAGTWLRRGSALRYTPTQCGVRMTVQVRRGDTFAYSAFFRHRPAVAAGHVSDGDEEVDFNRKPKLSESRGFSSGRDPSLVRVKMSFTRLRAGPLSITVCRATT